jgi:DNA-binding MarR family transcriptional regulator
MVNRDKKNDLPIDSSDRHSTLWTDFGTLVSHFTKVSRINSKSVGLSLPQAWMLQVISLQKGISPTELSAYSGTSLPSITDILDGLQKLHYIQRSRSRKDRRRIGISLSVEGNEKLQKFQNLQRSFVEKLEESLNDEYLDKFSEILSLLVKALSTIEYDENDFQ